MLMMLIQLPQRKTVVILDASKETRLEVNPEKTKYVLMSHSQ
jgi:hypothetical protein